MSVPLDRLYDFLDGISGHDLIIYGWRPHGSKKLQDLAAWSQVPKEWQDLRTRPTLIFHDQEPLDYDCSQWSVEQDFHVATAQYIDSPQITLPDIQKFYKKLHFTEFSISFFVDIF
jgi:hypothetical protein